VYQKIDYKSIHAKLVVIYPNGMPCL